MVYYLVYLTKQLYLIAGAVLRGLCHPPRTGQTTTETAAAIQRITTTRRTGGVEFTRTGSGNLTSQSWSSLGLSTLRVSRAIIPL